MKTLNDIIDKLSKDARGKLRRTAKRAFDLGWLEHSNKLIAAKLLQHSNTLPASRTKTRLKTMATFIAQHDELCYQDFIDYFDETLGWFPDPDLHEQIKIAFEGSRVVKLYMKFNKYDK